MACRGVSTSMRLDIISLVTGLVLFKDVQAAVQSSLYPAVDSVCLAKAFNITLGCLDALNGTVSCDATLLRMAGDVDNYIWHMDNVTALCTADCLYTASNWYWNVFDACSDDYVNVRGRLVPPYTIPGRTLDGMNIACLRPGDDVSQFPGIDGNEVTVTEVSSNSSSAANDPGTPTAPDSTELGSNLDKTSSSPVRLPPANNTHISQRQVASSGNTTGFCLIDSYSWVGSDIIRPDCSDSTSIERRCLDPTDVPDENQRIANLYPDDLLCSDCFIKMFYLRVASPYLPDLDYSDYLIEQYLDIVDVCDAEMPELMIRDLLEYDHANNTRNEPPANNSTSKVSSMACNRNLTITDLEKANLPNPFVSNTTFCDILSVAYNATTGDLNLAFDDPICTPQENFTSICLPAKCPVIEVPYNSTCTSVAKQVSTVDTNVTKTQLLSWNPHLLGFCDSLSKQYICADAPGGSYIPPAVSNNTSTDAGQQRGSGPGDSIGGGGIVGGGRNATMVPAGEPAPTPTQSGISPRCTEYALASKSDTCDSLSRLWHISRTDFFSWNQVLGLKGENCDTQLFLGYYYCIGVLDSPTATAPAATPTKAIARGPTQSGIIPTCNKLVESISGLGCEDFATAEGIAPTELYA
ncbi:uncharacterized protein GIQ15_04815 [Arthroderma uncinatum]|uniref:uncharacterized protein n=1 Tax=Arthroderma uncinatum TaxID=74035 RepID=UPI00144A5583|nr:uncharacterized protein GIQ15_04815 [Arthroderma uncinatum]KAF3482056.1 hypothetical protein GIQ15_04815 [Arthroderma uncinatum]